MVDAMSDPTPEMVEAARATVNEWLTELEGWTGVELEPLADAIAALLQRTVDAAVERARVEQHEATAATIHRQLVRLPTGGLRANLAIGEAVNAVEGVAAAPPPTPKETDQ